MNATEKLFKILDDLNIKWTFDIDRCNHATGHCYHTLPEVGFGSPDRDDARAGWRND
jgi:hypothetical protein